ncbi:MAG TPA: DNA polymerase III subunit beta [Deinococcales bacterium]|nr:DNA polymerase III subunit beta [Deinococcales bacterium]
MKLHVSTKALASTLAHLERVIPARSSNPGLSSLLIRLTESRVILSGTNLEIDLEASLTADASGEGTWALPAHVFGQVVRALPADTVDLTFEENEVRVVSGTFDTKLQLTDASQTPRLEFPEQFSGKIPAPLLARLLADVRYAAAVNDYQAVFRGILLELLDSHSRAVASDGFRLAWSHADEPSGLDASILVPARAAEEMDRLLDGAATVDLALRDGQISLRTEQYRMNVKLMEGTFPDYNRIIPAEMTLNVTVASEELKQAVTRVAVLADPGSNNRIDIFLADGTATITTEGAYGGAREEISLKDSDDGEQMSLSYNARYLLDAIRPLSGDVNIGFSGVTTPTIIKGMDDQGYLAMVVPLKTFAD